MKIYPVVFLASLIAILIVFVRSRKKILYVTKGSIIVRGIFKKVHLDPYDLKSIARTQNSISTLFPTCIVVAETSKETHRVYTRKITDEKWAEFIEDLK